MRLHARLIAVLLAGGTIAACAGGASKVGSADAAVDALADGEPRGDASAADAPRPTDGLAASDAPAADAPAADAPSPGDALPGDGAAADAPPSDAPPSDASSPADGPPPDAATSTALRLTEVYVDRDLAGDAVEFVELEGPPGTSLDGLTLRLIDSSGDVDAEVAVAPAGTSLGASGRWTVGGYNVYLIATSAHVDQAYSIASWGLDNTAGAVQLVRDPGRQLVDVVGYGASVPAPPTDPKATVEGTYVPLPGSRSESFGRLLGGADTGDNAADWCRMTATPGYANGACL